MDPDYRDRRRRERRESHGDPHDTERRRRKGHRATDSQGDLLPKPQRHSRQQSDSELDSPAPRRRRQSQSNTPAGSTPTGSGSRSRGSAALSLDAIAKLDKANAKTAGWKGYDYDEHYLKEVRKKEEKLEKDRVKEARDEKRKERAKQGQDDSKRRAYESDVAAEAVAQKRREERRKARESQKKSAATDDEREKRRSAYTEADRDKRRSQPDAAREKRKSQRDTSRDKRRSHTDTEKEKRKGHTDTEKEERRKHAAIYTPSELEEKKERRRQEKLLRTDNKKRRVISGPLAEEGGIDDEDEYQYMMEKRGGAGKPPTVYSEDELARRKKKKKWLIIGAISVLLALAIIIPVAIVTSKKSNPIAEGESVASSGAQKPNNGNLDGHDPSSVPDSDKGGILDPWSWWDTTDFNVTYTKETVGGLPIIGLNSTWDDNVQANDKVPNLQKSFEYGKMPIRGVNIGGWLELEPFITPSFFENYNKREGIVDEWTLCTKLGPAKSKETLEKHYAAFVNKQTFADIRDAGFDHVRIPFGYWMVQTYDNDPYVAQVSWRYFLRAIEYARQNGLRVNLDMHGAPGSQNGWNHSGRQGEIGWLNGPDGDKNAQRWLDVHHKLSVFFAQRRYKNVVTMYGLVNEPRMVDLDTDKVLKWTQKAIDQIRKDNITGIIVFGDGFMGLDNWQGQLQGNDDLLLDVHQYVIFNIDQLKLKHTDKLNFACNAWTQQSERSMSTTTGFGPTMCGEWSQADTDCTQYINNVGQGTRWEGTFDTGNASSSILVPQCPAEDKTCSCASAIADASAYSDAYKKFLYQFALAQITAFEAGWGWFYWTWETEKAPQWSWKLGMAAGILPKKVWERDWTCPTNLKDFDDFGKMGLAETY